MANPTIKLPAGFQLQQEADGTFSVIQTPSSNIASLAIAGLHTTMTTAGSQIPTAIAAPIAAAFAPNAWESVINVVGDVATGNYVGAAMTGIPLLVGAVTAGYAILTKTQAPTNEQIQTYVNGLNRDQLIGLLGESSATSTEAIASAQQQEGLPASAAPV